MERRFIKSEFEIRKASETDPVKISGIAAVVNSPTILYESNSNGQLFRMIEIVKPGAFDDCLDNDVRALVNHNPEKILGRTKAGTLRLSVDGKGNLGYEIDPPETSYSKDLQESINRGDISQSSFAFDVAPDGQTREVKETDSEYIVTRTITKFANLYDVSPVTFPAYEDTETSIRSKFEQEFKELREKKNQTQIVGTPNLDKINQRLRIRK